MIFTKGVDLASLLAFLEEHPHMCYPGEGVYPDTVRVDIEIPVGAALSELKHQPFVRFVLRSLPIYFCH